MQFLKRQPILVLILIVQTLLVLTYTLYVGSKEGWIFLQVATTNLASLTWNGQFTIDFSSYLLFSGLWIAWRGKFSLTSILLGIVASILGFIVFAPYFIWLLYKENGELLKVLTGSRNN